MKMQVIRTWGFGGSMRALVAENKDRSHGSPSLSSVGKRACDQL